MKKQPAWLLAAFFWLGYVVLLVTVPQWWPPDPKLPNAAAAQGYNTSLTFLLQALWTAFGLILFSACYGKSAFGNACLGLADGNGSKVAWPRAEIALTFLIFCLLYFPPFLARYGHYIEDNYFLAVLSRMECGELPYRDFEFVYGPLMIYPLHFWTKVFGFSMQSYYGFLALLQGALFATVVAVFQIYVSDWRKRLLSLLLLLPILFDTLLGLNWIGWRRMLPVFAILMVAARPFDPRVILASGVALGVQLAYSHEYGVAALAAAMSIYALMHIASPRLKHFVAAASLATVSVVAWLLLTILLTGNTFLDYFNSTAHILLQAGQLGLGQFKFYWTLHSLALFALLSIAVVAIGVGLRRIRGSTLAEGDRLIFAALVFAVISMKIALQRADIWHMSAPALALTFVFLLSPHRSLFTLPQSWNRAAWVFIVVMAVTNFIGILPTGSLYASGLAGGAIDVLAGRPAIGALDSRHYSVQTERTKPDKDLISLAKFLASHENADRRVLFYGDRWWMGYHVGVCSSGYAIYDLMYSDDIQPMRELLKANPDTLVVMGGNEYSRLFDKVKAGYTPPQLSITKRISSWTSTVHYRQSPIEREIKHRILKDRLGNYVSREYERIAQFGDEIVLANRSMAAKTPEVIND